MSLHQDEAMCCPCSGTTPKRSMVFCGCDAETAITAFCTSQQLRVSSPTSTVRLSSSLADLNTFGRYETQLSRSLVALTCAQILWAIGKAMGCICNHAIVGNKNHQQLHVRIRISLSGRYTGSLLLLVSMFDKIANSSACSKPFVRSEAFCRGSWLP